MWIISSSFFLSFFITLPRDTLHMQRELLEKVHRRTEQFCFCEYCRVSNSNSHNLCIPVFVLAHLLLLILRWRALHKMLAPFLTDSSLLLNLCCVLLRKTLSSCGTFWHVLLTKDYVVFQRIRWWRSTDGKISCILYSVVMSRYCNWETSSNNTHNVAAYHRAEETPQGRHTAVGPSHSYLKLQSSTKLSQPQHHSRYLLSNSHSDRKQPGQPWLWRQVRVGREIVEFPTNAVPNFSKSRSSHH